MNEKKWEYHNPEFECDKLNSELLKYAPWSGHRAFAYDLVAYLKPENITELGSHYGCSAFAFSQAVKDKDLTTVLNFVDTWQGDDFTQKYNNDVYTVFKKTVDEIYPTQNINMLRMTFDEALSSVEDKSVDILHIDGSHHYEDVKRDFEGWIDKVKDTGIIMLHDISEDVVLGDIMGSHTYWEELKERYEYTLEFDFSWGLGLIFKSRETYNDIKDSIDLQKYQRYNNALDVDFKDVLRQDYFKLKDRDMYIADLLSQKESLNGHISKYAEESTDMKAYIKKLEEDVASIGDKYKEDMDKTIKDYENEAENIRNAYESRIAQNLAAFEEEKAQLVKDYEKDKEVTVRAYESDKKEKEIAFEEEKKAIVQAYEGTVSGKDEYIRTLEERVNALTKENADISKKYAATLSGKIEKIRNRG
ncbi:MAG: class I SAM-dependent methyltransferase [Firmicutes bacterium]|nr:class I SAM-dependent methyltransferase [Bacillota bacterium]